MRMTRLALGGQRQREVRGNGRFALAGTVLVMRTTFAPCFEVIRCSFRLRLRMASEKSEPVPACVSRSEGASRRVRFPRRTAGMEERQDRLMRRCRSSAEWTVRRVRESSATRTRPRTSPTTPRADAGLQSRVGVDGRSGRLDRLVNDLDLRVAQNGGRRSGVDLDGGQQRVIDGLRVTARCRQREQAASATELADRLTGAR